LTPDSIKQKYAQTVVSTRIVPGCVLFLGEEERFYTVWVNRVVLTVRRLLPVFPHQQTFSGFAGMSQKCQERKSWFIVDIETPVRRYYETYRKAG